MNNAMAMAAPPSGFRKMLEENPQGWGNAPPRPQTPMEQEPWNYQGEIAHAAPGRSTPRRSPR